MKKKKEQKDQHPILNQVLSPEFLKQFKDSGELNSFMEDSHLGYTSIHQKESTAETHAMGRPVRKLRRLWVKLNWIFPGIVIAHLNRFLSLREAEQSKA